MPTNGHRIIAAATSQLWAMHPAKLDEVQAFLQAVADGERRTPAEARAAFGASRSTAPMKAGQVAVLPLLGTICQRANSLSAFSGGTSTEQFTAAFNAALNHEDVSAIVIDVDSPGGPTGGVEELAATIRKARGKKPVYAVCNGMMASGAYWIGAQADDVAVTPSGVIGGQGVFMVHVETSAMDEREGLKWSFIASDPRKTEGNGHQALSGEALEHLQAMVNDVNDQFVTAVAKGRSVSAKAVRQDFGGGRVFTAQRAVTLGIADRVASLEEVLAGLGVKRSAPAPGRRAEAPAGVTVGASTHTVDDAPSLGALDVLSGWNVGWEPLLAHRPKIQVPGSIFSEPPPLAATLLPVEAAAFSDCPECGAVMEWKEDDSDPHWECAACGAHASSEDESTEASADAGAGHNQANAGGAAPLPTDPPAPSPAAKAKENPVDTITEPQAGAGAQDALATADSIMTLAEAHGMPAAEARTLAFSGVTEAAAAKKILEWKGRQTNAAGTVSPSIRVGTSHDDERPFRSLGEQLVAIRTAGIGRDIDPRLDKVNRIAAAASGASTTIPSDGGFALQPTFVPGIASQMWDEGKILSRVNRIPIGEGSNGLVRNVLDERSRADGSRYGGVRVYRVAEAGTVEGSKPKMRPQRTNLEKLMGIYYATEEMLQDATALSVDAERGFRSELTFVSENEIFRGSGVGECLGFTKAKNLLVAVPKEGGQAAGTINVANVSKMMARLPARSYATACWFINISCIPQLVQLTLGNQPVFLPGGNLAGAPFGTLFGIPVEPVEYCEGLGAEGDIVLADLASYTAIDKGAPNWQPSLHVRFLYDETAFKLTYRFNGQPDWDEAVTPYKGGDKISPFVALAART